MDDMDDQKKALIDRYLLGQISVEEQQQFDQYMKDLAFQKEVELQKEFLKVIDYQGDTKLKKMFQEEENAIKKKGAMELKKRFSVQRIAAIAAGLLFLLWIGWQIFSPKPSDLFTENFAPHTNSLYPKVKSSENINDIQLAFYYYDEGEYEKALLKFESISPEDANDDISFYYANVLLELGETKKATTVLQKIIQNNQTNFLMPTKWNLALAYISLENYTDARLLLEEIKDDHFYQKNVEKLLGEPVFDGN